MIDAEKLLDDVEPYDHGKRSRYQYNGMGIPSVTELLSFIDSQGLINWANSIGLKGERNTDVAKKSADLGTKVHRSIEYFLKGKPISSNDSTVCLEGFKKWWKSINENNVVRVLGQEHRMQNQYFGGTYDLLISINDKPYLIDFKTSNHVGYKYFMQLSAYRYLLYTEENINIEGCVILHFDKEFPNYKEYALIFSDPVQYEYIESCFRSFMGLVYTYYNVKQLQRQFYNVF